MTNSAPIVRPRSWGNALRSSASALVSTVVHLVVVVTLAFIVVDTPLPVEITAMVVEVMRPEERPEELLKLELEQEMKIVQERTVALFSASPTAGEVATTGPLGVSTTEPTMDESLVEQLVAPEIKIEGLFVDVPPSREIIVATPEGQIGDARAIVDNYEQALDQITQEILWMMEKEPVLVIWCFDQSESMKDDQKEIRERIEHFYTQLGVVSKDVEDRLTTAVTSYGANFGVHTPRPTSDRNEIRAAIDNVPIDPSGEEMMCQAVARSLALFRSYALKTGRKVALILVTDESGNREDNDRFLEQAIVEAKAARSRVYVLGREAVFSYPYAHIRWIHPQTKHHHWIRIDRGPETAFVEQLQTDGFRRRHDAHPSGYGPYEQTRLARETGGIFFLLPSIESDLVQGEKRRYALDAMRPYQPDLRTRMEIISDRDDSHFRSTLWKVIYDLNPYDPNISKVIEMRMEFAPDLPTFAKQARQEQAKAVVYLQYLARAEEEVAKLQPLREREAKPRWQANYDLLYAQLIAYQARIYEYGSALEEFLQKPKLVPATKLPNLRHTHWDIGTRKELLTEAKSRPYIDRASSLFQQIIEEHAGTPWAARAEIELRRGFGIRIVEQYEGPSPSIPPGTPILPVPKL